MNEQDINSTLPEKKYFVFYHTVTNTGGLSREMHLWGFLEQLLWVILSSQQSCTGFSRGQVPPPFKGACKIKPLRQETYKFVECSGSGDDQVQHPQKSYDTMVICIFSLSTTLCYPAHQTFFRLPCVDTDITQRAAQVGELGTQKLETSDPSFIWAAIIQLTMQAFWATRGVRLPKGCIKAHVRDYSGNYKSGIS